MKVGHKKRRGRKPGAPGKAHSSHRSKGVIRDPISKAMRRERRKRHTVAEEPWES